MRKAFIPCVALFLTLALTTCDSQPVQPDPSSGVEVDGPSFAKGGVKGPPEWIEILRPIGPPPRVPVPLPPQAGPPPFLSSIVAIGTGYYFSCALSASGAAFCWGANSQGELGDGSLTPSTTPVEVSGDLAFIRLFVGDDRACGQTEDGTTYCWGANFNGQLGAGVSVGSFSTVPVPVAGGHTFTDLSMGLRSTCGMAEDGLAYCSGQNSFGQLGVDLPVGEHAYTPLPVVNSATLNLVTVNNGFVTTCGLDGSGAVYCWGRDGGNFGNGPGTPIIYPTPTPAASGMTFATVEVGSQHACALDQSGSAYCWGVRNYNGEQGIGSTTAAFSPTAVLGGHTFIQIDTDDTNRSWKSVCGVTPSYEAWCWGHNSFGNLGGPSTETCMGTYDCSTTPIPVSGGIKFASVSVGADHACGLALDASVWCWGSNEHGELGDGSLENSPVPVPVRDLIGR